MSELSNEGRAAIRDVVEADTRKYWSAIDKFAQADSCCYPTLPSALEKANAELGVRQAIPRKTRDQLQEILWWAVKRLKGWQRELELVQVDGERRLFSALENLVQHLKVTIQDMDNVPTRLEKIIATIKNPPLGVFTVTALAEAHWIELNPLLTRPGALDLLPAAKERQKEIESLEDSVRGRIEAGQFRSRPGSAIIKPRQNDDVGGDTNWDPRQ